ncbi:MAG: hypothetical protein INF43_00610 [Alphaproteobacteria bacterium]|nr:hypothetical protein [Alphaproteobacteria bacterium]
MYVGPTNTVAGATGSGGPLAQVPNDVRTVLTQIAEAPGLVESERTALVQATATASSIANADLRAVALRQVSSMGLYLSRTGDSGLPRWTVMTALRAYGLNLQAAPKAATPEQDAQAAQAVARQVAAAGASRGVTVQQALQNTAASQAAIPVPSPVQLKNAAVVNFGGVKGSTGGGDAASLTTQLLSKLV